MNVKRFGQVAGVLGLAVAIALIVYGGWHSVTSAIAQAGWGLLWLLPFHALPLLLDVCAWRVLLSPRDPARRATIPVLFWIATIREASNRLLPLASVGGEIIGIRLLRWRGVAAAAAAASVVMEVLLTIFNQYIFIGLGIVLLVLTTARTGALEPTLIALALSLPVPLALAALLRYGDVFTRFGPVARRLLGENAERLAELFDAYHLDLEIRALYARWRRLVVAGIWQLLGLVVGSFENWLILRMLGHPVGPADAIALEALTQGVRHVFFVVPSALGVQEGGLILLGDLIGLPTDISVALSLVKRMREIAFGVPALISWQWAEVHRLRTRWRSEGRRGTRDGGPDHAGRYSEDPDVKYP